MKEDFVMTRVAYTKENVDKCWCGSCPVQKDSACAKELYERAKDATDLPPAEQLPGLYCATGKARCEDLEWTNLCNCPACLVWAENRLMHNHYCALGSVAETR